MAHTVPRRTPPPTIEDYLCAEETSFLKHEYIAGQIYALAGASERHNLIAGNIFGHLWTVAGVGPCRVYGSDMRLRIADLAVYYPDVQVVCDPTDTEQAYKTSPCVVVEVLSPSTESIDLREKLLAYRGIESLQAYVIVYRDQQRVVRHFRDPEYGWWDTRIVSDSEGKVPFPCPAVELTLADIYRGLAPTG